MHEESSYVGYDGLKMHMQEWGPDETPCKAVVLAIHGMTMHSGQMRQIGEFLSNQGICVQAPDMRGFGHFQGIKGHVDDYKEFMLDLQSLLEQVKERYPDEQIYMLGHSLGGLHTINFALQYPRAVDGIILSAPAVTESAKISNAKRVAARLISIINLKKHFDAGIYAEDMARDPDVVESIRQDPLRFKFMTARFGISVQNAMKHAASSGSKIDVPVLLLQGGEDKLVDPVKTKEFFESLAVEDKTWKYYEGFYHTLPQLKGNEYVLQDILEWINGRVSTSDGP
jgi:alpha-beta hydrolase superfamily lysophospholipase